MIIADRVKQLEEEIQLVEERLSDIRQTATGEANTASNIGAGGVGPYAQKVGVDLQFRNINAGSARITVALDAGNNEIDIDVDPSQIDLNDLGNVNTAGVANNDIIYWNLGAGEWQVKAEAGGGDVVGPGASTDHAIARFDGVTGKLLQDSPLAILTDSPILFLNDSVNTKMTRGITIHQGATVDEIVSLKASINHGITGVTETDTFLMIMQTNAGGGAYFYALEESGAHVGSPGASLRCYTKTSRTDHTIAGHATMMAYGAYCGGGTSRTTAPAGFNVYAIRTYDSASSWKTLHIWAEDGEQFIWGINPKIFINETTNVRMDIGITIHQGSYSNEVIAFKKTGIAHGITGKAETDTYAKFQVMQSDFGGLLLEAYQEAGGTAQATLAFDGFTQVSKTTMGPTGIPAVSIRGMYCGGGTTRVAAPANFIIAGFGTYDSSGNWRYKWQIDQEGDTWQKGGIDMGGSITSGNPILKISGWDSHAGALDTYAILAGMDAGAGTRLTFGLDETMRAMVICDISDINADFGLSPSGNAALYIYGTDAASGIKISANNIEGIAGSLSLSAAWNLLFTTVHQMTFRLTTDLDGGNAFTFESVANIELSDADAEQAWMYLGPKIKQTSTAGYIGFLMDVIETNLGSGLNALMDLRVATVSKFLVRNDGGIFPGGMKSGANQGAAGAAVGELWHDTNDDTIKMGV